MNSHFRNPFPANVPIIEKPSSWFSLAECVKTTCGRSDILSKVQVDELRLYLNYHSSTGAFHKFF